MHLKKTINIFTIALISFCLFFTFILTTSCKEAEPIEEIEPMEGAGEQKMVIESPAFKDNEKIPVIYTCDSDDINPPLLTSNVPDKAKSLVLIVDDPDAPFKTWIHWTVWNIDPKTREIAENSVPDEAIEGVTDFGSSGYRGPCPPSGTHHYFFKIFALDTTLELDSSATAKDLINAIRNHVLDKAELVGLYK